LQATLVRGIVIYRTLITPFCRNINLRGPMTITKYIVARTAKEASSFWSSVLCHDTQNDAQDYLNRCKLLGPGSHSIDVIFRCTLQVEAVTH